jgi:leucyl-tRNA synthetase
LQSKKETAMEYNHKEIEKKWQKHWKENNVYKVEIDKNKPKYYVLDMFPYPSGAGLHVGHPLGYIASDIYSRYKRLNGFNVLHPMGYDAFGLPAEQYAIQTGQHPAKTTEVNIKRYREQLDKIGFSYDWNREVRTSDPDYYKWTQWGFTQLFKHWFNKKTNKAENIESLIKEFENAGNTKVDAATTNEILFSPQEWDAMDEEQQQEILLDYRLAYLSETKVNWCPFLGTVLANDEVVGGLSVRGGHHVEQKEMKQWFLRVSAYAERLLKGLDKLNWSDSLKEIQRNWIGFSEGANMFFSLKDKALKIEVFTTRPDTIFGANFMVLAPESDYVKQLVIPEQKEEVEKYVVATKKRSERERIAEVKNISGVFSGAYAINPLTNKEIPIWISDYVLAGYGTGAVMAVPAHDSRDFAFAKHFNLPITQVVLAEGDEATNPQEWEDSYDSKDGKMINSEFINDLSVQKAIEEAIKYIEENKIGSFKINYRLRDAIFSRQRYWGEPFPVYFKGKTPYILEDDKLPLELPKVDKFLPTEDGQPPLGRAENWKNEENYPLELSTMPGFAGSSAYYLRYMDPRNNTEFVSREANEYWQDVDLYIGGTEHATGHLVYARFWNKFLYDLGLVVKDEPFKKMVNQGMIQGRSNFVYRIKDTNSFVSKDKKSEYTTAEIHVDVNIVKNDILDIEAFKKWSPDFAEAEFILSEDGKYHCGWAIEKMSKSMYNVVNPDDIVEQYGADTLRLYEMFLGPLEQSKPWDTNGIDGVYKFFKKLWRLFYDEKGNIIVSDEQPDKEELKILHTLIKKIKNDIENFSFNTSISAFMICVNDLTTKKSRKKAILKEVLITLSPFAPHIAEELWETINQEGLVLNAKFPTFSEEYLIESEVDYPVSFNGKMRFKLPLSAEMKNDEIEKIVLEHENSQKWIEGKTIRKIIIVPKKIINIVVS